MGRLIFSSYNPNAVEPPEPSYDFNIECPNCGAELHEGDEVYQIYEKGSPTIFACEHCIRDFSTFVEDL